MTNPTTITAAPGLPFVEVVRDFDAPVAAVFNAHVDPEFFVKWTGPRMLTMEIIAFDAQTGGQWKYISREPNGTEHGFRGVFHTVDTDKSIVQTFEYAGAPGMVSMSMAVFDDLGDERTRVSTRSLFPTVEARDAMVANGMEYGATESYERLDEVLAGS